MFLGLLNKMPKINWLNVLGLLNGYRHLTGLMSPWPLNTRRKLNWLYVPGPIERDAENEDGRGSIGHLNTCQQI